MAGDLGPIPMDPTCPRCGGKHEIEVSGDGYEWDCGACGGHLICAVGNDGGEMFPCHREDGSCGCVGEPHTCEPDDHFRSEECELCGHVDGERSGPKYAVWLHSRGWLVDTCGSSANVADRLYGATWFSTEEEARVALEAAELAEGVVVAHLSELGEVVTL